tara:strand:- start:295 stop:1167 length:873 start_codon:yes stop_codon:yes gene_type:complete
MQNINIGFIGLGNMGAPMAKNLCDSGYKLFCYDINDAKNRLPVGATLATSISHIAKSAEIIFLCLPNGNIVLEVIDNILKTTDIKTKIIVDNTTAGVSDAKKAWERLNTAKINYVDAPVSGGVSGAKAGTLAMMVAAPDNIYKNLNPIISCMAKNARHVGNEAGQGMAMKLLNNFLSGMAMAASSEALAFGVSQGLKAETVIEVLNLSTGRNTSTEDKFPKRILTETFDSGFATTLMAKDLTLYVESAQAASAPNFLSSNLLEGIWAKMLKQWPSSDFTKIYPFIRDYGK